MINSDKNIEKIIKLMETDDSVDASSDAIKWSKNIFRTRSVESKATAFQRIVGVLVEELIPGKAAFGERAASVGKVRQMLFEAGENRVDLRVSPSAKGFDIRGQILGRGWEGASIEFAGHNANVDKFGGFKVNGVGAGIFDLSIKGERIEIVLIGIGLE